MFQKFQEYSKVTNGEIGVFKKVIKDTVASEKVVWWPKGGANN